MNTASLLSELKALANDGSLTADDAARLADGDAFLLMHAAAGADARARGAIGTDQYQRWSAVAMACTDAIRSRSARTRQ